MADRHSSQSGEEYHSGYHEELRLLDGEEQREARSCMLCILATVNAAKFFCGLLVLYDASVARYDGFIDSAWFGLSLLVAAALMASGVAGYWLSSNGFKICIPTPYKLRQLRWYFIYMAFFVVFALWSMTYLAVNYSDAAASFRAHIVGNWDQFYANLPEGVHHDTPSCENSPPSMADGSTSGDCWEELQQIYHVHWRFAAVIMGVVSLVLVPLSIFAAGATLTWAKAFDAVQDAAAYISVVLGVFFLATAGYLWVTSDGSDGSDELNNKLLGFSLVIGILEFAVGTLVFCPLVCGCCVSEAQVGMILFYAYSGMAILSFAFSMLLLTVDDRDAATQIVESLCRTEACLDTLAQKYDLAQTNREDAKLLLIEWFVTRINSLGWFLLLNFYYKLLNAMLALGDWKLHRFFERERATDPYRLSHRTAHV